MNDLAPVGGIDRDGDGIIDKQDWADKQFLWKFRIVSRATFTQAISDFDLGITKFSTLAAEWLNAFKNGTAPGDGEVQPDVRFFTGRDSGRTHANGAITSAASGRTGSSKSVTHKPKSLVVQQIMKAPAVAQWVVDAIRAKANDIDAKLGSNSISGSIEINPVPGVGGISKLTIFYNANGDFAEMYAVVGDAQEFNPTLRLEVARDPIINNRIRVLNARFINSFISDVFDWDYDVIIKGVNTSGMPYYGWMARAGAILQAAHGTIGGNGGGAFRNIYLLDVDCLYPGAVLDVQK